MNELHWLFSLGTHSCLWVYFFFLKKQSRTDLGLIRLIPRLSVSPMLGGDFLENYALSRVEDTMMKFLCTTIKLSFCRSACFNSTHPQHGMHSYRFQPRLRHDVDFNGKQKSSRPDVPRTFKVPIVHPHFRQIQDIPEALKPALRSQGFVMRYFTIGILTRGNIAR